MVEEAASLGTDFPVFRQIAASLTHHPDRWDGLAAARKNLKKWFDGRSLCQVTFPFRCDNFDCQF
jgi:hypothetical protein